METLKIEKTWAPIAKKLGITEAFAHRLNGQISRLNVFNPPDSDILFVERKQLQYNLGMLTPERRLVHGPQALVSLPGLVWRINTDVGVLKSVFDSTKSHDEASRAIQTFIDLCRKRIFGSIEDQWIKVSRSTNLYDRYEVQNELLAVKYAELDLFAAAVRKGQRVSVLNIRDFTQKKIEAVKKITE